MKTRDGYVRVRAPNHPKASKRGYYLEHRLVMEAAIGRYLERSEVVHHINGDRADNRIENLHLCESNGRHNATFHARGVCWCGEPAQGYGYCPKHYKDMVRSRTQQKRPLIPAAIVVRIKEMAAAGDGCAAIAKALNMRDSTVSKIVRGVRRSKVHIATSPDEQQESPPCQPHS